MTETAVSTLLESVVELTSQRDQHSLQLCLFKTLQEFICASEIALHTLSAETGPLTLKLLLEANTHNETKGSASSRQSAPLSFDEDPDLMQSFTTGAQVVSHIKGATGDKNQAAIRVIHPVTGVNGIIGFLIIKCASFIQKDQDLAASFLCIYRNYTQLMDANEHDTLTGLLNRKTFSDRIMRILSAQQDSQRHSADSTVKSKQHCLAMLDIDHFKNVNDKFGHLYGDEVLLLFSRLMSKTFREEDQLYRYGGEEFVVVLRGVDLTTGLSVLERFRKKVESFHFPQVGNVTVSIGAVEINYQDLPTTIVEQADKALYYAKDHGRNQVCEYGRLLAEGKLSNIQSQGSVEIF